MWIELASTVALLFGQQTLDLTKENIDSISAEEKRKRAGAALVRMREASNQVMDKLTEAQATKDVVKLNCVSEKSGRIKGLLRVAGQADVLMEEAIARRDPATANAEYAKIRIADTKIIQLRAEAEQCLGQLAFRTDENSLLEVIVPENIIAFDPSVFRPIPGIRVRPPPASPTTIGGN